MKAAGSPHLDARAYRCQLRTQLKLVEQPKTLAARLELSIKARGEIFHCFETEGNLTYYVRDDTKAQGRGGLPVMPSCP